MNISNCQIDFLSIKVPPPGTLGPPQKATLAHKDGPPDRGKIPNMENFE